MVEDGRPETRWRDAPPTGIHQVRSVSLGGVRGKVCFGFPFDEGRVPPRAGGDNERPRRLTMLLTSWVFGEVLNPLKLGPYAPRLVVVGGVPSVRLQLEFG